MSIVSRFASKACLSTIVASAFIFGLVGNATATDYEAENLSISAASPAAANVTGQAGSSNNAFVAFSSSPTAAGTYYIELTTQSLTAGTYSLSYLHKANNNRGRYQVSVDGVNVGAIGDQYASAATNMVNISVGTVTLTAGTHRIRWTTNSKNSSSSGYSIALDRITLTSTGTNYSLTTNAPNGTITRNPNATSYASGTVVTLTASANANYIFSSWSGDLSGPTNPTTVTMNSNKSVTANFTYSPTYTISITASNGTVVRDPQGPNYPPGTSVTLTAVPNANYQFSAWGGAASGSANPTTVTVNSNISVTATFTAFSGETWLGTTPKALYPKSAACNVGIGTTSSSTHKLYVTNPDANCYAIYSSAGGDAAGVMSLVSSGSSNPTMSVTSFGNNAAYFYGAVRVNGGRFTVDGSSYFNNPVGIGQEPGSEMLEVAGNIKCAGVKINDWSIEAPDYVFEKDYKLRSLDEVEKHIESTKHLPEVPSAIDMKKNGVDLSELNMTLLKKIEELTLYVIDQNKKLEKLEKKMADK